MRVLLTIFIINCVWCNIAHCVGVAPGEESPDNSDNNDAYYPENITCEHVDKIIKCARLPEHTISSSSVDNIVVRGDYISDASFADAVAIDDENWSHMRDGVPIIGIGTEVSVSTQGPFYTYGSDCKITSPYSATFYANVSVRAVSDVTAAELCANVATNSSINGENGYLHTVPPSALDGDVCPDGFFTVPYESWCGDGMVNIADTPYCNDDASGEYCLMKLFQPCTAGISAIKTSTGLSFPLYAEKYTEPSVAVMYNNITCYSNLEIGQSNNTMNINYNGTIYHLTN